MFESFEASSTAHSGIYNPSGSLLSSQQFVQIGRYTPTETPQLTREFQKLVKRWKADTINLSSLSSMTLHHAYLRIIGMGSSVLPLLFDELRKEPDHWFVALTAITGANPIETGDAGNVDRMTNAWLDWARENGY